MNKPQVGIKLKVQFTKKAYKEFQKINKVNSKQFDQLFNALKELEKILIQISIKHIKETLNLEEYELEIIVYVLKFNRQILSLFVYVKR